MARYGQSFKDKAVARLLPSVELILDLETPPITSSLMSQKVCTTSEREKSSSGGPAWANGMSVRVATVARA